MDLSGKVALVTGSARRVGKVIALALAARGMHIVVHYHRSKFEAAETASEIKKMGVGALPCQADLADPAQIAEMFTCLEQRLGRLDVLVNSASTFPRGDVLTRSVETWDHVMAVNLRAPFLCGQQAARLMLKNETPGVIINIADTAGLAPWVHYPDHSVSKAGLIMLTRVMASALGPQIRVNAIVPGPVLKPDMMDSARWRAIGERLPLGRTGHPENVAHVALTMIENDFVTGAVWGVDGGDSLISSMDLP
ncbi:MAG: 3-oxoacyl-[acyl-carrier-protein] reductase [Anaerolineae bacterium]